MSKATEMTHSTLTAEIKRLATQAYISAFADAVEKQRGKQAADNVRSSEGSGGWIATEKCIVAAIEATGLPQEVAKLQPEVERLRDLLLDCRELLDDDGTTCKNRKLRSALMPKLDKAIDSVTKDSYET